MKFYSNRGQLAAMVPTEAVKTKCFMATCETARRRAGLKHTTEPMSPPSDGGEMHIEVNVGSALAAPKFIYSDKDGQTGVLAGESLTLELKILEKYFIFI